MSSTRCGISAKQLERELGVTYKTAWRMFKQIRSLLAEEIELSGEVEADETYIGGRRRGAKRGRAVIGEHRTPVIGIAQRGGKVAALVTKDASSASIMPIVRSKVLPRSLIYTDEWRGYNALGHNGYQHKRIAHAEKVYVMGNIHTNTIEGFWSLLKRGIEGVYHSVSAKHLQSYINEYAFRYNHRGDAQAMFRSVSGRVRKVRKGRYGEYAPIG
jgi:transposase-like protein